MTGTLTHYERARRELAEAVRVDEAKSIRDKAEAMQVYARQAKDTELLEYATEIRIRAEIRAGELLREMEKNKGEAGPGRGKAGSPTKPAFNAPPKLSDLGISKKQSMHWQKLAALSPEQQEEKINLAKRKHANASKPKGGPKPERRKHSQAKTDRAASLVLDHGKTYEQAAVESGVNSIQVVKTSVAREEGRRDVPIDPSTLSQTSQQKLEAAIRQHKRALDLEYEARVSDGVCQFANEVWLPEHQKQLDDAEEVLKSRWKGIMDSTTYRKIWSCLHPDSRHSVTERKLQEAFAAFERAKVVLLSEEDTPTPKHDLPRSYAEWMERKRHVSDVRKTKRSMTKGF